MEASMRILLAAALIFAAMLVLIQCGDDDDDDAAGDDDAADDDDDDNNDDNDDDDHAYPCSVNRAVELLRTGQTETARDEFACLMKNHIAPGQAGLGFGMCELLLWLDDIYSALLDQTHEENPNIADFVDRVWDVYLDDGGKLSRMDLVIEALSGAMRWPESRLDLQGFVLEVNDLQTYVNPIELDFGDALILRAVFRAVKAFLEIARAYDVNGNLDHLFAWTGTEDHPVLSIRMDVGALLRDPAYPEFLSLNDDAKAWFDKARLDFLGAVLDLRAATQVIPNETDNQTVEYLADLPDLLQSDLLALQGEFFVPGQVGPIDIRAPMVLIFATDRTGLLAKVHALWPKGPADFPAFLPWYLTGVADSLEGSFENVLPYLPINLKLLFDHPGLIRPLLLLLFPESTPKAGKGEGEPGGDLLPGFDPAGVAETGNGYLLAGFTREGRLKNLFYPGTTSYNHVPYLATVGPPDFSYSPVPFMGADRRHGSFVGLRSDSGLVWPMDWYDWDNGDARDTDRPVTTRYEDPDSPVLTIRYTDPAGDFSLVETAFSPMTPDGPQSTLVRRFEVTNESGAPRDVSLVYYAAFNINAHNQWLVNADFFNWILDPNDVAFDGNALTWTGPGWRGWYGEDETSACAIRIDSDRGHTLLRSGLGELAESDDGAYGLAMDAQSDTTPLTGAGHTNGYLEWDLGTLSAGQSATLSVLLSVDQAADGPTARQQAAGQAQAVRTAGVDAVLAQTEQYWFDWVDAGTVPALMNDDERALFKRSLLVLKLGQSALTGACPSNHNMQPMYYMIWGRDSAMHSAAFDAAGFFDEAALFLDYMTRLQAPDGHWKTYYTTLGDFLGAFENEQDQTPTVVWAYWIHWRMTSDDDWLADNWATIKRAADYLLGARADNGLMWASADIAEAADVVRQSLYTNAIAAAALNASVQMAQAMNEPEAADSYAQGAREIRQAVEDVLWIEEKGTFWTALGATGPYIYDSYTTPIYPFNIYEINDPKSASFFDYQFAPWVANVDPLSETQAGWVPQMLNVALFLYHRYNVDGDPQDAAWAHNLVAQCENNLTESGMLAETFIGHGRTILSKPIAWGHAMYVLYQFSRLGGSPLPLPQFVEE